MSKHTNTIPPEHFRRFGNACYGEHWQAEMSAAMGINRRTIQRWAAGHTEMDRRHADQLWWIAQTRTAELLASIDQLGLSK